jgi:hypothetical protein
VRRGILGPCHNEESPAQSAELPGCSPTATGRKVSALRSMPGRRRTNWPRITGRQSQAGALIRTRPTIATERGTGASSDQNPAASRTAWPGERGYRYPGAACRLRGWGQPRGNAGARPNHQSDEDDADRLPGFGHRRRVHAVGWPLRMHPGQSPADPGLTRHAPPPPAAGVNTPRNLRAPGHMVGVSQGAGHQRPDPRGADHGART